MGEAIIIIIIIILQILYSSSNSLVPIVPHILWLPLGNNQPGPFFLIIHHSLPYFIIKPYVRVIRHTTPGSPNSSAFLLSTSINLKIPSFPLPQLTITYRIYVSLNFFLYSSITPFPCSFSMHVETLLRE